MPSIFSSTEAFRLSYFRKARRNTGITSRTMMNSITATKGIMPRNIMEMSLEIRKDITVAKMIMTGARITMRIIIIKDCCTFMTSVVSLVTMDGVENLSIFSKEKDWMRSNMSFLRFLDSPVTASADAIPLPAPHTSDAIASRTSTRP